MWPILYLLLYEVSVTLKVYTNTSFLCHVISQLPHLPASDKTAYT